ncbi:MAG TPA: response regulator [Candidatus Egerieimonas intestinavium]|uniref:Stage 0 sporulation protein A homolog n=1 Tax=Candidatus Egerieimonas intestinavium TaxID=2840777 RepID=A0A9D1EJK0_9FIRM|nr:response regulator [Candidatus Egerieimonas intestinavium]
MEAEMRQRGSSNTILIVDDNEINRDILEAIFSSEYQTEKAEDGKEGLDKLLAHPDSIAALLLDIVMPVMDGMEVLRKLYTLGLTETIPVFLITAETEPSTLKEAYSLGVMDVIRKPVVPYVVRRRINSVVELFRARKSLADQVEEQRNKILHQAQQIIDLNMGMIEALSTAIEFRSGESGAHVRRLHDITKHMLTHTALGEGLDRETIEHISLAAIMHDVGKIAIPDAILNKPGRLTPEEFEVMKTHTVQGCHLLEQIPQMKELAAFDYAYDIARHHHERWDGRGYPDGLKGDEISIWSQIVSLADVYDALVSKRVYKDAYGAEQALKMIQEGQCGVFNPQLLELFVREEKKFRSLYQR